MCLEILLPAGRKKVFCETFPHLVKWSNVHPSVAPSLPPAIIEKWSPQDAQGMKGSKPYGSWFIFKASLVKGLPQPLHNKEEKNMADGLETLRMNLSW